jgi:hypothetical protein
MPVKNIVVGSIVGVLAAGSLLAAARAEHLKPGMWKVTTAVDFGVVATQVPADQLARLQSLGIRLPSAPQGITTQQCLTREQSLRDIPPHIGPNDSGCASKNEKASGARMSADLVCTGRMAGQGTVQLTHTDEGHYSGSLTFKGMIDGHPVDLTSKIDGEWLSKDCR